MTRINITRITDFDLLEDYREGWSNLLPSAAYSSVFQTFEWMSCWWQVFSNGAGLEFYIAEVEKKLVGIAPFEIRKQKINGVTEKVLNFIGGFNYSSDYLDFVLDKEHAEEILESFLITMKQYQHLWTVFSWNNMPGFSINRLRLEEFFKNRKHAVLTKFLYDAPCLINKEGSAFSEVLSKKSLQRKLRQIDAAGELNFRHVKEPEEAVEFLDMLVVQHKERWNKGKSKSLFYDEQQVRFFRLLLDEMLLAGSIKFSVLEVGGEVAALHYGFEFQGVYLWYKPSFSEKFAEYSPGQVILNKLIQYCNENNLLEFDFGCGSEFFKYRFSNHVRKIYRMDVYTRKLSLCLRGSKDCLRWIKKKLKKN